MRKSEISLRARDFNFRYADNDEEKELQIRIYEACFGNKVLDPAYGFYVWPCAPILTSYIAKRACDIKNKNILEIGCGTALVGIAASKLGGNVIISDGSKFPDSLENAKRNVKENNLTNVKFTSIDWGVLDSNILDLGPIDLIVASDCFYDTKDFEPVLVTVSYLLKENKGCEFWTTYQIRSSSRSIEHLLEKWKLRARNIPLNSFGCDDQNIMLFVMTHAH